MALAFVGLGGHLVLVLQNLHERLMEPLHVLRPLQLSGQVGEKLNG